MAIGCPCGPSRAADLACIGSLTLDTQTPLENPLGPYSSMMLSVRQLIEFGTEGFIVVRGLVPEALLAAADQEIDELLEAEPCPEDVRGKQFYFKSPSTVVAADATLRDSAAMDLAEQLVAPHRLVHAYGHIQVALNVPPFDHRPDGPHLDGNHDPERPHPFTMLVGIFLSDETTFDAGNLWVWPRSHVDHADLFARKGTNALMPTWGHSTLLDPPVRLHEPIAVRAGRGDVLFAHYLLGHASGGNLTDRTRRILYYRLSSEDHESHWARALTDPLYEYAPVANAVRGGIE